MTVGQFSSKLILEIPSRCSTLCFGRYMLLPGSSCLKLALVNSKFRHQNQNQSGRLRNRILPRSSQNLQELFQSSSPMLYITRHALPTLLLALLVLAHSETKGEPTSINDKNRLTLSIKINNSLHEKLNRTFGKDDSKGYFEIVAATSNKSKLLETNSPPTTAASTPKPAEQSVSPSKANKPQKPTHIIVEASVTPQTAIPINSATSASTVIPTATPIPLSTPAPSTLSNTSSIPVLVSGPIPAAEPVPAVVPIVIPVTSSILVPTVVPPVSVAPVTPVTPITIVKPIPPPNTNLVRGVDNVIEGQQNILDGDKNHVAGDHNIAAGHNNEIQGLGNDVIANQAFIKGHMNTVIQGDIVDESQLY